MYRCPDNCPQGKSLPPPSRIIDSLDNCPLYDCSPDYWPRTMDPLPPRTITSEENCPRKIAPGLLPPPAISSEDNCCRVKLPLGNCALDDCARKITPKIIVPYNIPLEIAPEENCLSDDLPYT